MPSSMPDIPTLIRRCKGNPRKGGRTYRDLVARRPIDPSTGLPLGPDQARIEQMAQYGVRTFSHPDTMKGLAVMLGVSQQGVIDSYAVSCNMEVNRRKSVLEILLPDEVNDLSPESIHMILGLVNERIAIDKIATMTLAATTPKRRPRTTKPRTATPTTRPQQQQQKAAAH